MRQDRDERSADVADLAAAFDGVRRSLTRRLLALEPGAWSTPIPMRPEWTVKDALAVLAGIAEALVEGTWTDDYSDSWADRALRDRLQARFREMIEARRDRTGEEILREWSRLATRLEPMMAEREPFPPGTHPFAAWTYLWAVVQNAHNIWTALGVPSRERDSEATAMCLESAIYWLDMRLQAKGLPALRLRTGEREWVVGDGVPAATVTAPPFDLFRALSGRRSLEQIRAFSWDGDPEPYLEVFSPFEAPREPIVE